MMIKKNISIFVAFLKETALIVKKGKMYNKF
jgi:hypothetical protein